MNLTSFIIRYSLLVIRYSRDSAYSISFRQWIVSRARTRGHVNPLGPVVTPCGAASGGSEWRLPVGTPWQNWQMALNLKRRNHV